ncbi:MAG: hypothetical protein ABIP95_16860 [Pelobium sp.]
MSNKESFDELIIQFPLLKSEIIEEDPEMTHMRMERFADYTIKQIESDNNIELKKCLLLQ